jgi:hypothetical protein
MPSDGAFRMSKEVTKKRQVSLSGHEDPNLADVLHELDEYRSLGPDWDSEDALPVSGEAVSAASNFVRLVDRAARTAGIPWIAPTVGPVPSGGIDVWWDGEGRSALITFEADVHHAICVTRRAGARPVRQELPIEEAIDRALWAMGGCGEGGVGRSGGRQADETYGYGKRVLWVGATADT